MGPLTQDKMVTFGGRTEHLIKFDGVPSGISQAGLETVVREVLIRDINAYVSSRN